MDDIRPARTTDVWEMVDILVQQQQRSVYSGQVNVDPQYTRRLLAQAIQRHGGTTDGGTLVNVVVRDGKIIAFFLGMLQRFYNIGDRLEAHDMFLAGHPDYVLQNVRGLVRAYVSWASANPAVFEIILSHRGASPESARVARIFEKQGFAPCGGIHILRRKG